MTDIKHKIGQQIREARIKAELTQQELGDKLGVGSATVNGYEAGRQNLTIETLEKISTALGSVLKIEI